MARVAFSTWRPGLTGDSPPGHAFTVAAALQVALLAGCAALSLLLSRHIAADAYQPTL